MIREFHLVSVYSCHRGSYHRRVKTLNDFYPLRYCTVRHSPSFAIPQLSPTRIAGKFYFCYVLFHGTKFSVGLFT